MFLLWRVNRENLDITQPRVPGVTEINWEENQDFYVPFFFIQTFIIVPVFVCPAGGFIVLRSGAAL